VLGARSKCSSPPASGVGRTIEPIGTQSNSLPHSFEFKEAWEGHVPICSRFNCPTLPRGETVVGLRLTVLTCSMTATMSPQMILRMLSAAHDSRLLGHASA
jgi:hypothetical protein